MLDQMAREANDHPIHAAVLHADVVEEAEALREQVRRRFNCKELYDATELIPVMGAHTDPGVLGVAHSVD